MFLARIIGSLAVRKNSDAFDGHTLVIVRPIQIEDSDPSNLRSGSNTLVAIDTIGAERGDVVMLAQGVSVIKALANAPVPADTFVVATVDALTVRGSIIYRSKNTGQAHQTDAINGDANGCPDSADDLHANPKPDPVREDRSTECAVPAAAIRRKVQPGS